jgi:DNA-binding transcriptional MerR regulator
MNERDLAASKAYYRIGEVSSLVGVEPHVLRYWEREFRMIRPVKSPKGQRVYSARDVDKLKRVRELLYTEGFTIAGARKQLRTALTTPAPAAEDARTHELATVNAAHSNTRQELLALREEIEAALGALSGTLGSP